MSTRLASRRTVAHTGRPASHRSRQAGERAMLRGGSDVLIRPVRHDDAVLLADGFDRLGAQSRRFRFLTADTRMAVSYVTNQMLEPADDNRGLELVMAAYDGLKGLRS